LSGLLTFVLLVMLLVGGLAYLFDSQIDAAGPLERTKVVAIPKNEGAHEIATRLEREGVVSDRRLFVAGYLWAKFVAWLDGGKPVQLKAGDYGIKQNASIRQVIDILSEGKTVAYKVTVPEGLTSYQIVEKLKADPNLSGEIASVPPEGSLLPDTFMVDRGMQRQTILDRMQAQARRAAEKAWAQRRKDLPLKSLEEAIVLASIVEKETGRGDERERVAAVFVNRLKANMRLQSDPTILYGLSGGKTVWNRPIHRSEIAQKTSHNTYQIDGLPPTPICNPGRAAIEAVLNPADTKELFFVADGTGRHVFAETIKEHNANVQKWRAAEKDIKAKAGAPLAAEETPTTAVQPPAEPAKKPKTRAVVRTAPPPAGKAAPAEAAKELPWAPKPKP
jgi:peptidoglycan lytic transglycosylase G